MIAADNFKSTETEPRGPGETGTSSAARPRIETFSDRFPEHLFRPGIERRDTAEMRGWKTQREAADVSIQLLR